MNPNFIPLDAVSTQPFDLDSIQIANPCRADWGAMSGDERTRHCKACAKNVYNLSAMTRAQAMRLIEAKEGHLCVRLHRRADGTLITSDCTVGISDFQKPRWAIQKVFAASIAAILGVFGLSGARAAQEHPAPTLGAPTTMEMGEAPQVLGRIQVQPMMGKPRVAPKVVATKAAQKSVKTHAKSAATTRKPKTALQHRRHR